MYSCWYVCPKSRPMFDALEQTIYKLLETNVAEHYVFLNEIYLKANANSFDIGQTDYLALMASPDYPAPSAPNDIENDDFDVSHIIKPNVKTHEEIDNPLNEFVSEQNIVEVEIHRSSNENVEMQTPNLSKQSERSGDSDADEIYL